MSDQTSDLLLKRIHAMAFREANPRANPGYEGAGVRANSCRKSLLLLALFFAGHQTGIAQDQSESIADAKNATGWDLNQSAAAGENQSAVAREKERDTAISESTQAETAAPPTLDIQAASERQKLQAQQAPNENQDVGAEFNPESTESNAELDPELAASNENVQATRGIPTRPVIDLSPELRDALERQFQQVRKLLETEEAFSEALGEVYLSYGTLLKQAGRLDEARKMLVNALHIAKVNNGVNSIEQRPVLRALFEMNLALKNTEELEGNLRRIIWLEKKIPEQADDYSFDMVVRLGNHFLDLYLENPVVTDYNLSNLSKATLYFRLAVNRYGDRPLAELFMPYGELAYSHFLKSRIQAEVDRSRSQETTRQRSFLELDQRAKSSTSLGGSFSTSERYLREYLAKAEKENEQEHRVQALLNLGDLNILFGRRVSAIRYYEQAWDASDALPLGHPLIASFEQPQLLPAFRFANKRPDTRASAETFGSNDEFQLVPLTFDIDTDGNVKSIQREASDGTKGWSLSRAKRIARQMKFRPIIDSGKLVRSFGHQQDIKIKVRGGNSSKNTG